MGCASVVLQKLEPFDERVLNKPSSLSPRFDNRQYLL